MVLLLCVGAGLRSVRDTLLAVAPTFFAVGAMLASMRLIGLDFNPLNILALPVVIGIAVDDGVHLVHRMRSAGGDLGAALAGTGRAIVLTSATTAAAFGALALAQHRGLTSFAQVLLLGVICCLVLSVAALPSALRWFGAGSAVASENRPAGVRIS